MRAAAPTVAGRRASFPAKRMAKLSASKALAGRSLQVSESSQRAMGRVENFEEQREMTQHQLTPVHRFIRSTYHFLCPARVA